MFLYYSHHYPWTAVVFQNKAALTQIFVLMPVICELRFSVVPLHLPPTNRKRFKITCHLEGFYSPYLYWSGEYVYVTTNPRFEMVKFSAGSRPWDKGEPGLSKKNFSPKIRGGEGPRGPSPRSAAEVAKFSTQLFRDRLSEKEHATIPKGIMGGFGFSVLRRNLKHWHERPWT